MADRSGEPRWITIVVAHRVAVFYLIAFAIVIPSALLMALVTPAGAPTIGTYVFSTLGAAGPLLALAILEKVTRGEAVTLKRVFARVRYGRGVPAGLADLGTRGALRAWSGG